MALTLSVSLGGSRLEVGFVLDEPAGPSYCGSGPIDWRRALNVAAPSSRDLCDLVAAHIVHLLDLKKYGQNKDVNLGVAFPGPQSDGLWFSNNLTDDFRNGVPLAIHLQDALRSKREFECARTIVFLDAQADAGGEIYHPEGAFSKYKKAERGCVLNVATGVAAGFVDGDCQFGVLNSRKEFESATSGFFDDGGGQLGRHLFVSSDGEWSYHYRHRGEVATDIDGIRMTDYLSGPALSARLALELTCRNERLGDGLEYNWIQRQAEQFCRQDSVWKNRAATIREFGIRIRKNREPGSRMLLSWADQALVDAATATPLREALANFRQAVTSDFGRALSAFQIQEGWEPYFKTIVLTGGVGQNLFAVSDPSFISNIRSFLRPGTTLDRSKLSGGGERVAWFFHFGVFR